MSLESLQSLWMVVLWLAVLLFLTVEVVVVFGGARDVVQMWQSLKEHAEQERAEHESA
ncbi:MAG: hypothetical protein VX733_03720 [Candidatus Latescibacterota bacterium]|nr:hypothetical protein [Candidatus Latescibacterota bacterium]